MQPNSIFNVSALHGIIALRQGERETAHEAFTAPSRRRMKSLPRRPIITRRWMRRGWRCAGWQLLGATRRVARTEIDDAIETFRKARKIAPHAGVVKSVLRLFDELVKCDEEGILKDVRKAVEGKG